MTGPEFLAQLEAAGQLQLCRHYKSLSSSQQQELEGNLQVLTRP